MSGSPPTAPGPEPGRRVLVIDDNEDAAESLRVMLQLHGHAVEVALSGADGLETARRFLPEVVLCDLGLPQLDGLAVAEAMRADPELRGARLIAITGYGGPEDVERALRAGFDTHLTKPADPVRLLELVAA
ncbi:MAG TPA: response regulator [Vicinamibacteria bacterium]|nr:response regulator [Vicinamibacteria bacterium]